MALSPLASATVKAVTPTEIEPGKDVDISIAYAANNPGGAMWSTCIVVRRLDTGKIYGKLHKMIGAKDDYIIEPMVCGSMTESPLQIVVEIWANDDYWAGKPAFVTD